MVLVVLLLSGGSLVYLFVYQYDSYACSQFKGTTNVLKCQVKSSGFGAVVKYSLPAPDRDPNAIVAAPDGSVWFGEQALPGIGHLYPTNGTLVEYAWPGTYGMQSGGSGSTYKTDIWGVAQWNGRMWGSDGAGNRLVGIDPSTWSIQSVNLPTSDSFPYTLTVGPENSLWFTELVSSQIGRLYPNGTLHEYSSPDKTPAQIVFKNETVGYLVTVGDPAKPVGHVYEFNPTDGFSPIVVGGTEPLYSPDSVAVAQDGLGVIQHGPSQIKFYDLNTGPWSTYPTSSVPYTNTVLPYFAIGNGSLIWFNEHYGNRIATLDVSKGTLTEYNEANPAPTTVSGIDNALTIALGNEKLWFTEWTANNIGYVDATFRPGFSIGLAGGSSVQVHQGGTVDLTLVVSGQSSRPLSLNSSDSETFTAAPHNITIGIDQTSIQTLNGHQDVKATITTDSGSSVGNYTLAFTVTDGLISQTVYVKMEVTA